MSIDGVVYTIDQTHLMICPEGRQGAFTISNAVNDIFSYAFFHCTGITSVSIPNSVTVILNSAFSGCIALTSMDVHGTMKKLDTPFEGCTNLTSVTLPSSVTEMFATFQDCTSLTTVVIPSSVTSLQQAFNGCTSITTMDIPSSVTNLQATFGRCTNLTSMIIPPSVTNLGGTFYGCTKLTTLDIPASVDTLTATFNGCTNLTNLTCHWTSLSKLDTNEYTFQDVPVSSVSLSVPKGSSDIYRTTFPWSAFKLFVEQDGVNSASPCEVPTITYADKKLNFVTTTDGAQIYYDVTSVDVKNGDIASATDLSLDQAYKIVAYAWKDGYTRSDSTTAVLYFVAPAEIPSGVQALQTDNRGILVKSAGGIITVSGLTDGETVTVYTIGGTSLGSAKASAGQASITVSTSDHIVIITMGSKSIKYAL